MAYFGGENSEKLWQRHDLRLIIIFIAFIVGLFWIVVYLLQGALARTVTTPEAAAHTARFAAA